MKSAQSHGILRSKIPFIPADSIAELLRFCRIELDNTIFYRGQCVCGIMTAMNPRNPMEFYGVGIHLSPRIPWPSC